MAFWLAMFSTPILISFTLKSILVWSTYSPAPDACSSSSTPDDWYWAVALIFGISIVIWNCIESMSERTFTIDRLLTPYASMLRKLARYPSGPLPSAMLISSTTTGSTCKETGNATRVLQIPQEL
uniref:Uncharacterized protein n=1 Tax=Anopheles melas TaxID=34690 RepID=A0A182U4Q9_9DIPT